VGGPLFLLIQWGNPQEPQTGMQKCWSYTCSLVPVFHRSCRRLQYE